MTEKIFQMVDGQRVPKPGNQRDPSRRYSATCDVSTGERYLLEFTPEEEAARDAEEAQWERERPQREAAEQVRLKEEEKFRESLKYESRIVAFLDVLGWSEAIKRSQVDGEVVKKLGLGARMLFSQQSLSSWLREHGGGQGWSGDPQVTQFSDCIVLSGTPDRYGFEHIVRSIDFICRSMLWGGFLIRGAITVGQMLHRDQMCYGPALIEAYEAERKLAYYPRIVLVGGLQDLVGRGDEYHDKDGQLLGFKKTWRNCPFDGLKFFDYLQPFNATTFEPTSQNSVRTHLECSRKIVTNGLETWKERPDIYVKYVWRAKYLNAVIGEYPDAGVEVVAI